MQIFSPQRGCTTERNQNCLQNLRQQLRRWRRLM